MKDFKSSPYFFTALVYSIFGLMAAIEALAISWGWLAGINSISWTRIHFITLGIVSQAIFGYVPKHLHPNSETDWNIWILLNAGIVTFFFGRGIVNAPIMIVGGMLVFIATLLFVIQLVSLRDGEYQTGKFYITATIFLLFGIVLGTSIWAGWNSVLGIHNALEAHIHANNWGFLSLVFAALLLDLYPTFTGKQIHWPNSIGLIYMTLTIGGVGLVMGPWIGNIPITVAGMISFIIGGVTLLLDITLPLRGERKEIGVLHLLAAYVWIFVPLFFAPFVIFEFQGFEWVEPSAPQALIYGWVLQFAIAIIPYFISGKLGGTKQTLVLTNAGAVFLWISIFAGEFRLYFHGAAYLLWTIAILLWIRSIIRQVEI